MQGMLVIKLEHWPNGKEENVHEISRVVISPAGGTMDVGNFDVKLLNSIDYKPTVTAKAVQVKGFRRDDGALALLRAALSALLSSTKR